METIRSSKPLRAAGVAVMGALLVGTIWGSFPHRADASESGRSAGRSKGLDRACAGSGRLSAARLPAKVSLDRCDLVGRTIVSGSVALRVPGPGRAVGGAALAPTGESELSISTSRDGVVTIVEGDEAEEAVTQSGADALLGPSPPPEPCDKYAISGCLAPCDTNNYHLYPNKPRVKKGQPWLFKSTSTPGSLTPAVALAQIKAGTKNIVTSKNDCALGDVVPKTSIYKGTTTLGSGIKVQNGANKCGRSNQKNVVDFGALQAPVIGLACWYSMKIGNNPWFIVEADLRFKSTTLWTTIPDDPSCPVDTYDLQGVVTHERGHAFGVTHADGDIANSQLTMFPSLYQCSSYARTLGKGDVSALNRLY